MVGRFVQALQSDLAIKTTSAAARRWSLYQGLTVHSQNEIMVCIILSLCSISLTRPQKGFFPTPDIVQFFSLTPNIEAKNCDIPKTS